MRTYRNATVITALLTIGSFLVAAYLNFWTGVDPFWCNLLLGIFGSSFLTFITSVVGYRVERRKTFEGFSYFSKEILRNLNKYQTSWTLDEKIDFFLAYHDISCAEWDRYFGEFCFLFDFRKKKRQYIYENIYQPLLMVNQKIGHHIWHFRWHKDGSGRNEQVMKRFLQEIEDLIIETTVEEYPNLEDFPEDMRDSIEVNTISTTRNKIVEDVQKELIGKYYCYMCGNKAYKNYCSENSHSVKAV